MAAARWRRLSVGVALATVLATGCGQDEPEPVVAAKAFTQAVRSANTERVLELVDEQTVARVAIAAERASDQVGGRRSIDPVEMFQVIDVDLRFQIKSAELVSQSGDEAVVSLTGADDTTRTLAMVRQQQTWRVRLSAPASATPSHDE